jgi:hypothetical protein
LPLHEHQENFTKETTMCYYWPIIMYCGHFMKLFITDLLEKTSTFDVESTESIYTLMVMLYSASTELYDHISFDDWNKTVDLYVARTKLDKQLEVGLFYRVNLSESQSGIGVR